MSRYLCAALAVVACAATAVAQQAVVKKNQTEAGYAVKFAAVKLAVWSDKDYAITLLPASLKGAVVVVRPAGAGRDWLDAGEYTAAADCTAYLAVRSEFNGKAAFGADKVKKLTAAGWSEVMETFRVGPPKDENWKWRVFKKDIPKGKVDVRMAGVKLDTMAVFFFGKKHD